MTSILVKHGKYAGIEYPSLLEEAIGNINLEDWYKGDGFGYALGEIEDKYVGSVIPSDFDIREEEEDYTTTEYTEDGEKQVTKKRKVNYATFIKERYNSRMNEQEGETMDTRRDKA